MGEAVGVAGISWRTEGDMGRRPESVILLKKTFPLCGCYYYIFRRLASLECFSGPDLGKEFVMSVFFTPLVF